MINNKKAILLINVGTPESPDKKAVRKYLSEFLNDPRMIDMPAMLRYFLVNFIIVPFRAPKSAKLYKIMWNDKGSPLLYYTNKLVEKVNANLGVNYDVYPAMRYGNPSLKKALTDIKNKKYDEIIVVPLFPQYASSTSGSILELVFNEISGWYIIPKVSSVPTFYSNDHYLNAVISKSDDFDINKYDHVIFSYHGLPLSHINSSHPEIDESKCSCPDTMPSHGRYCYKAQCYETTRLLTDKLNLSKDRYSVSFQSRFAKKWLSPFTDELLKKLAGRGIKRILVFAPSFVTDCLETIVEINYEYKELFKKYGGEELDLVPSLNDSDDWADALTQIIRQNL